jgi:multidrug efflux pump subunit AcrA (membrane-fusion protein)
VLVIDDISIVEVRVRVPELKLREINIGSPITLYFPALDRHLEVPITRIGNTVDPRSRTIELIIDVDNADLSIKSGMSVELEIQAPKKLQEPAAEAAPDPENQEGASPTAMIAAPQDRAG